MPATTHRNDINLLMTGKTGVGKSATGNTITGKKKFKSKLSGTSVTQKCEHAFAEQQGKEITVVDMPGLSDGSLSREEDVQRIIEKATEAVVETPGGYDAILIVIRLDRFTQEDKLIIALLKEIFGKEFIKQYGILVITHADLFDPEENDGQSLEEWCSTQEGDLKELIIECNRRVVFFQNRSKEEGIRAQQLQELIALVENLQSKERYTPKLFEEAVASRNRLMLEMKLPVISEKVERKFDKLFNKLKKLQSTKSANNLEKMRKLKKEADELLIEVQIEDKGTGSLSNVIKMIESAQKAIEAAINAASHKNDPRMEQEAHKKAEEAIMKYKKSKEDQKTLNAEIMEHLKLAAATLGITVAVAGLLTLGLITIPAVIQLLTTTSPVTVTSILKVTTGGAVAVAAIGGGVKCAVSSIRSIHGEPHSKSD